MSIKDILWICSMGLGSGFAGLAVFELVRRFAAPRHADPPVRSAYKRAG